MDGVQKVAIITGASRGIGANLVSAFLRSGYVIVANSRTITQSDVASDPRVVAIDGDIGLPDTAERLVEGAIGHFGRLDTLVNNAGLFMSKPFTSYSDDDFLSMTAVNLSGFFHVTRRAAERMLSAGQGHIVTITATIAEQPMTAVPAALSALTKGGLNAATRSLALEYADRGIRVNAVSPGIIDTPMHAPEMHDALASLQPMKRMGLTVEVAEAVLYLEGAAFVTGEILHVDGGSHAGRW